MLYFSRTPQQNMWGHLITCHILISWTWNTIWNTHDTSPHVKVPPAFKRFVDDLHILHQRSSESSGPNFSNSSPLEELPGPKRKGLSSNKHFFRGELLNFRSVSNTSIEGYNSSFPNLFIVVLVDPKVENCYHLRGVDFAANCFNGKIGGV